MITVLRNQLLAVLLFISLNSTAQFTITETFRNSSSTGVTLGGNAMLTAGTQDPAGDGWLRLTPAVINQSGYGIVNASFPSTLGVLVDFEYTAWRNTSAGADGFSVFLFNAAAAFKIGGTGGSLGYAQNSDIVPTNTGLAGGYLGIGIDEFGNFSSVVNGKNGGPGNTPNAIAVRGPAPNYTYITGNQIIASDAATGDNGGVDYNTLTTTRPTPAQFYRRLQFEIVPGTGGNYVLTVKWKKSPTGAFITLLGPQTLTTPPPAFLKVGFAASTGAVVNIHEIRNVLITTPGNVRVNKTAQTTANYSGAPVTIPYQIVVGNGTAGTVTGIGFTDQLPTGYAVTLADITVTNFGNPVNQVNNLAVLPSGTITADINLAAKEEVMITVNGKYTGTPPSIMLLNLATVGQGNITDIDLTNNTSLVSTSIMLVLPVTLKNFTARRAGSDVLLEWITTDEQHFSHIEIERSADGITFTLLEHVPAQAGNASEKQYQYTDVNAPADGAFYRLKLVDLDGRYSYSAIRRAGPIQDNPNWTVYPNPASDKTVVELPADWKQGVTHWSIVDMAGRKLASGAGYSVSQLQIPLTAIPEGRYTLLLQQQQKGLRHVVSIQVAR